MISRYTILLILNLPLVFIGLLGTLQQLANKKVSRASIVIKALIWLVILFGLIFSESIYDFLYSNNLTQTSSLSLFDVVEITGINYLLVIVRNVSKSLMEAQARINELNQEASIRLSEIEARRSLTKD